MKSVKELMEELGFNKNGSDETQKAFIKHLIREANRLNPNYKSSDVTTSVKHKNIKTEIQHSKSEVKPKKSIPEIQLAFDFEDKKNVS